MLRLKGATGRVESLTFSPDGGSLAVPRSGRVQVWEIAAPDSPRENILEHGINCVRFLPGGRKMILGGRLLLYDRDRKESTQITPPRGHFDLSPDGTELAVIYGQTLRLLRLGDLAAPVWSVERGYYSYSPPTFLSRTRLVVLEHFYDATMRGGNTYVTYDATTGQVVSEVRVAKDDYVNPVISAARRLMAARRGIRIAVFPCGDFNSKVALIRNDSRQEYTGLAFHPSGRFLAATSNDATVKLYDTTTWKLAHAFDWEIGRLRSVAFSPDGTLAAGGGDKGKIVVWDFDL